MNMRVDSLEIVHHQAVIEIGNTELKKQSDRAKRLGNEDYRNHPQLNVVKSAVRSLQPDQLLKVLKNTQQALEGKGGTTSINQREMPKLQAPLQSAAQVVAGSNVKGVSAYARMVGLLGEVSQLSSDMSLAKLMTQLQGFNAMMSSAGQAYSALAAQIEQQGIQFASDSDALKSAQQQADALAQKVTNAQSALDTAQNTLSDLEATAAQQDPVSADLQQQIDAAKSTVADARNTLTQATQTYNNFVDKTLNPAINAEQSSKAALDSSLSQSDALVDSLAPQQQSVIEAQHKQGNELAKSLTYLMALMAKLIDSSASDDLQATAELKQKLSEAAAKDAEIKGKEYDEQVRKADEMQEMTGCISKVLSWVVAVVGVAAAVFTGGASMIAVAAIGLALTVGDEICQAVTGHSFIEDAVQPLMDKVIKPLIEMMAKVFSAALEAMGVDKDTAAIVGQVLGAIAAMAILIAGAMVAGSAVSKVAGVVMKKLGMDVAEKATETLAKKVAEDVAEDVAENATKTTMQRLMDSTVGQTYKRLSQGIGRSMGMDELDVATISNRTEKALTGMRMVDTTTEAAGSIAVASMMVDAAKIRAQMMKDSELQNLLNQMMDIAINSFSSRIETVNQIAKNMSAVAENQMQTGMYITRKMAAVAG